MKTIRSAMVIATLLLTVGGCESTAPKTLEDFQWVSVQDQNSVTDGIDAQSFFGDVDFIGQFKTPSLCYNIAASFSKSGSTLTLRVDAKSTNSPNCNQTPGGFQYTGVLRHLDAGMYTFHVIHAVEGQTPQEFSVSLTI
jgi:hypothetical protein